MLREVSRGWLAALVLTACLASPAVVSAQAPSQESPAQSGEPAIRGLDRLSPEERAQAERNLQKWKEMTPEQPQRPLENDRQWQSLSPEERQVARQNDQRLRRMAPADRARVQEDFRRFQSLPPERQRELECDQQFAEPQVHARAGRAAGLLVKSVGRRSAGGLPSGPECDQERGRGQQRETESEDRKAKLNLVDARKASGEEQD